MNYVIYIFVLHFSFIKLNIKIYHKTMNEERIILQINNKKIIQEIIIIRCNTI